MCPGDPVLRHQHWIRQQIDIKCPVAAMLHRSMPQVLHGPFATETEAKYSCLQVNIVATALWLLDGTFDYQKNHRLHQSVLAMLHP